MYFETQQLEQLYQLMMRYDTIILHRHVRPDPDALGSQLGLRALLRHTFPTKKILAAGTISSGLKWLGEADAVSAQDYEGALVIVCDTANQPRIDGDYYNRGDKLVKIDHHPAVDFYGDLQIVQTQASSCSEMIVSMSRYFQERLPMTDEAARLLYAGIVGDTGRFLFQSTTEYTFDCSAYLKQFNFSMYDINDRMQTMTLEEAQFQGFVLENLRINEAGVGYVIIHQADIEAYGITEEQTNGVIGVIGRIAGVVSWVVCVEQATQNYYRCRLRSKGPTINTIAAEHEGGGHPQASGANAYSLDEIQTIVEKLTHAVKQWQDQ